MDIYSNFPHCYPVPDPQSTKSTLAPPAPKQMSYLLHSNSCWNNIIALSAGYANVHISQRIGEMVQKMDIFTNVLCKIFLKGSMHLIYERNLILFHNPLFQAVDARFN